MPLLVKMLLVSPVWSLGRHLKGYSLTWKEKATKSNVLLFQLAVSKRSIDEIGSGLLPTMRSSMTDHITPERIKDKHNNLEKALAKMLPTPVSRDWKNGGKPEDGRIQRKIKQGWTLELNDMATMGLLPTPAANDGFNTGTPYVTKNGTIRAKNPDGSTSRMGLEGVVRFLPTPQARDYKGGFSEKSEAFKEREKHSRGVPLPEHLLRENYSGPLNSRFVEQMMGFPVGWTDLANAHSRRSSRSLGEKLFKKKLELIAHTSMSGGAIG